MINANISNNNSTHIGNFPINIDFGEDVEDFVISDLTFTAVFGNGLNNIARTLTGSGATYMVNVSLPGNVIGAFSVAITGQVTVSGVSQEVVATVKTFHYDTVFDVRTEFQEPKYNDAENEIILPITYSEPVFWFDKSDLTIKKMVGSEPFLLEHYVRGEGKFYEVVFSSAPNTWGAFTVDITGEVVKETDLVREIVNVDPVLISYNNRTPTLANVGTPFKSSDGWWNISLEFESPVVGFGNHSIITGIKENETFIYRGRSLDVEPTTVPPAFSKVYSFEEAQKPHCVGDWATVVDLQLREQARSREQARYFWVKLNSDEEKAPEILLKDEHGLRPVSVAI